MSNQGNMTLKKQEWFELYISWMLHGSIYESMIYQSSDVHQSVQHSLPKENMANWSDSSNNSSGQKNSQKDAKAQSEQG